MPTDRLTLTATTDPLTADTARTLGIALVQAAAAAGQTLRLTSTEGRSTVAQELAKARARVAELEERIGTLVESRQHWRNAAGLRRQDEERQRRRADATEAQVAAVRDALADVEAEADKRRGYREIQAAERAGLIMAISRIRQALDTASTPESATEQPSAQVGTAANGANQPVASPWPEITDTDEADFDQTLTEEGLRPALETFATEMIGRFPPTVTDAMVRAAIDGAERAGGFAHDTDRGEREQLVRAALEAALGTPAAEPHGGQDCPDRIEVTGWGMTDREWICGCDPRPDATAPAETTSPSEAP